MGHATAEIAVHVGDDLFLARIGILRQKRSGLHDPPGLAIAALRDLLGDPGLRVHAPRQMQFGTN
jgi:hypothetical protein